MADEKFEIDIDVDSKDAVRAFKALERQVKKLSKANDRLRRSGQKFSRAEAFSNKIAKGKARVLKDFVSQTRRMDAASKRSAAISQRLAAGTRRINTRNAVAAARLRRRTAGRATAFQRKQEIVAAKAAAAGRESAPLARIANGFRGIGTQAIFAVGAITAVGTAITAAIVAKFGVAVTKAKEFNVTTRVAFDALTGSAEGGADALARSNRLADEFSIGIEDVTGSMKKLLAAQFSLGQSETFIKLGTDLRAIGTDAEGVKSAIRAITQIKAKGRLQADELLQLSEANISQELIFGQLKKSLGVGTSDEVRKIIEAGKVDAETALAAIQGAILKKTGSKEAGEAGKKFADVSLSALRTRIENARFRLFQDVAEKSTDSFERLRTVGDELIKFIQELDREKLGNIFDLAVTGLDSLVKIGKSFFTGFVDRFADGSGGLEDFLRALSDEENLKRVENMGKALGDLAINAGKLAAIAGQLSFLTFGGAREDEKQQVVSKMEGIGVEVASGFARGMAAGQNPVMAAATSLGMAAINAFERTFDIGSPSKVMEKLGGNVTEGFNEGIKAPSMAAAARGSAASQQITSGATNNISLGGLSVNSEISGGQDPAAIAAEVERTAINVIGRAFESMALQGGVA